MPRILVVGSDGTYATDSQPLARMNVFCLAREGTNTSRGSAGGGGRVGIEYFQTEKTPEHFAQEAVRQAIIQLDAIEAPAGEMEVVLGPGWPGILLIWTPQSNPAKGKQSPRFSGTAAKASFD